MNKILIFLFLSGSILFAQTAEEQLEIYFARLPGTISIDEKDIIFEDAESKTWFNHTYNFSYLLNTTEYLYSSGKLGLDEETRIIYQWKTETGPTEKLEVDLEWWSEFIKTHNEDEINAELSKLTDGFNLKWKESYYNLQESLPNMQER